MNVKLRTFSNENKKNLERVYIMSKKIIFSL